MLSKTLEISIHQAIALANEFKHQFTTIEHLLLSLTKDERTHKVMMNCGINVDKINVQLREYLANNNNLTGNKKYSKPTMGFQRVIHKAAITIHAAGKKEVTGVDVLIEIFSEHETFAYSILSEQKVTKLDIINHVSHGLMIDNKHDENLFAQTSSKEFPERERREKNSDKSLGKNIEIYKEINTSPAASVNTALDAYCVNLNQLALSGEIDRVIGRATEIDRTIEILSRRSKNNPLLIGEPGVGKTAIAEGLALIITEGKAPEALKHSTIYSLDIGVLLAGTRYRGDFEDRIKTIIKEIERNPHAILFIDEIHTIIGAGATSGGSLDASNLLKPALAKGKFRCIGSTTFKEYHTHFEKDHALVRRFQKVVVEEPSVEETIQILRGVRSYYENYHKVHFTEGAIESAALLSERYIKQKQLPDKAIDVIDEAGARHKISKTRSKKAITVKDIESVIARMVNIPPRTISVHDTYKLQNLETNLKNIIFGQDKAIEDLCAAIKLSRAGLRNHNKPIGCYLFSGPTGVGKTELAKQLARLMHMELLRFDMSEYMEKHSVARLIGSPPGYVGYDQGGLLTEAVDNNPYCVVLLDEIEKADHEIYNILLQVMDYGRLTDNNGRNINFCNAMIIMTTNLGADEINRGPMGFGKDDLVSSIPNIAINRFFSPEFINRLDTIISFEKLNNGVIKSVVDKFIVSLEEMLSERNVTIKVDPSVRDYLAIAGYDEKNGARPMERIIDNKIKRPLADQILFGCLSKGGKVKVSMKNDEIIFSYKKGN